MKSRGIYSYFMLALVAISVLSFTGCPKKPPVVVPPPAPEVVTSTATVSDELPISDKVFQAVNEIVPVYFDYDSFELSAEARTKLQNNVTFLQKYPELELLVEGNCCECGTNEYNLALGQKRAKVVRDYYVKLGIAPGKIGTISYGEEKPVNVNAGPPDSPQCAANRRTETKVRKKTAAGAGETK
jgi:peptidoglycan-associated lipoprotein